MVCSCLALAASRSERLSTIVVGDDPAGGVERFDELGAPGMANGELPSHTGRVGDMSGVSTKNFARRFTPGERPGELLSELDSVVDGGERSSERSEAFFWGVVGLIV